MTSKAHRKRKSDASPVEFCSRSLAGGNVWDSLTDLLKIMKLRGEGANDIKEVREKLASEIVNRKRRTSITCCLRLLTTCMRAIWDENSFLDRAPVLVKKASMSMQITILQSLTGVAQSKKE